MSGAYYNEVNAHAAGWLRNLVAAGLVCPGDVDERDIRDVCAADLKGYTQHHFFAGIGIWSLALRMAGWPDDRAVSTGSCPCQPFSGAGKGGRFADERHLWPAWHWLIRQYQPDTIFGEQVEGAAGRAWLDVVSADLEDLSYAVAPVVLPVASVGSPNIRHRLFWVADAKSRGRGINGLFDEANGSREDTGQPALCYEAAGRLGDAGGTGLPDAESQGMEESWWRKEGRATEQPGGPYDPWRELEWIACLDGKQRAAQPGIFPLAARHPGDVAILRAAGNAISPQVASEVIRAYLDVA